MNSHATRSGVAASVTLAAVVLATSCVLGRRPDPTRFYVLAAAVPDSGLGPSSLAIGVGPIAMPGYLQRAELATRVGAEVRYADGDRWAEPLPTLFGRALGQDLSALTGARIVSYPWYRGASPDVAVRVDVAAFEGNAAGDAILDACWSIRDSTAKTACRDECALIVEPVAGHGAAARVAALGRATSELAQRVASTIRSCRRG